MTRLRSHLIVLVAAAVLSACAEVGRPPGGAPDKTPPALADAEPGSLAVGVDPRAPLRLTFSEKVDRRRVARAVSVIPEIELGKPRFDGTVVEFRPERPWPSDTVVVWVLAPELTDKHGVKLGEERQGAFTTGTSFPEASIVGTATLAVPPVEPPARSGDRAASRADATKKPGTDWTRLRAELELPAREGERRARRWRAAQGDERGGFVLPWLDRPSGPYHLRVYLDKNGNARRDEREPVAEVDSLFLSVADSIFVVDSASLRLVDLEGPVDFVFCVTPGEPDSLALQVWVQGDEEMRPRKALVDSTLCVVMSLPVGPVRFGAWLDDGNGRFDVDSTGVSEAFLWPDTLVVEPAQPDTVRLAWPVQRLSQSELDSLRTPPVPADLSSPGPRGP